MEKVHVENVKLYWELFWICVHGQWNRVFFPILSRKSPWIVVIIIEKRERLKKEICVWILVVISNCVYSWEICILMLREMDDIQLWNIALYMLNEYRCLISFKKMYWKRMYEMLLNKLVLRKWMHGVDQVNYCVNKRNRIIA